ncbi:TPA: hypothetical protein ACH9IR_004734, partial [Escherichia coli]
LPGFSLTIIAFAFVPYICAPRGVDNLKRFLSAASISQPCSKMSGTAEARHTIAVPVATSH